MRVGRKNSPAESEKLFGIDFVQNEEDQSTHDLLESDLALGRNIGVLKEFANELIGRRTERRKI